MSAFAESAEKDREAMSKIGSQSHEREMRKLELKRLKLTHDRELQREANEISKLKLQIQLAHGGHPPITPTYDIQPAFNSRLPPMASMPYNAVGSGSSSSSASNGYEAQDFVLPSADPNPYHSPDGASTSSSSNQYDAPIDLARFWAGDDSEPNRIPNY